MARVLKDVSNGLVSEELKQYYNDMKSVGLSHVSLATLITSDGQTVGLLQW